MQEMNMLIPHDLNEFTYDLFQFSLGRVFLRTPLIFCSEYELSAVASFPIVRESLMYTIPFCVYTLCS